MCVLLHEVRVLLCLVFDQFLECFNVFSHSPLPFIIIALLLLLSLFLLLLLVITVIIISTELQALYDGCLGWGWVWRAFCVLLLPEFGVSSSSPQAPGHPTSMCDAGVKVALSTTYRIFLNFAKNCPL